jgi:hypothetical protein
MIYVSFFSARCHKFVIGEGRTVPEQFLNIADLPAGQTLHLKSSQWLAVGLASSASSADMKMFSGTCIQ